MLSDLNNRNFQSYRLFIPCKTIISTVQKSSKTITTQKTGKMEYTEENRSELIKAVLSEDTEAVKRQLTFRCEQSDVDQALCEAALTGNLIVANILLQNQNPKPSMRYSDEQGQRAIHYACTGGSADMVKLLYCMGSAIHASDNRGMYPLHVAAKLGHAEIVKILIARNAHINSSRTFKVQATPLHLAVEANHLDCVKALVDSGRANLNLMTSQEDGGYTPLHKAVVCKFFEGMRFLCDRGANIDHRDYAEGKAALHYAAEMEEPEYVQSLLGAGAHVDAVASNGRTPLMYAAYNNREENAIALIEYGADVNFVEETAGFTAVHAALTSDANDVLRILLDAGADPNAPKSRLEHPLLIASSTGNHEFVRLLLEAGADVDVKTRRNATVMHKCQRVPCML